jgi:hypothetical protein
MQNPSASQSQHFSIFRSAADEVAEHASKEVVTSEGRQSPPVPDPEWGLVLGVTMMRTLEYRLPGFTDDVQRRLEQSAERMERSLDPDHHAVGPSVRDLLASWVFTESSALGARSEP